MWDYLSNIPDSEAVIIGADLNCHVGERENGFESLHGGKEFGMKNNGERFLEMAS